MPPSEKAKFRDRIAAPVGMSGRQYEKAKKVVDSGQQDVIQQMDETGNVHQLPRLSAAI